MVECIDGAVGSHEEPVPGVVAVDDGHHDDGPLLREGGAERAGDARGVVMAG
mgnify:CR=1 FL=1